VNVRCGPNSDRNTVAPALVATGYVGARAQSNFDIRFIAESAHPSGPFGDWLWVRSARGPEEASCRGFGESPLLRQERKYFTGRYWFAKKISLGLGATLLQQTFELFLRLDPFACRRHSEAVA
jgi:hypothetical protein